MGPDLCSHSVSPSLWHTVGTQETLVQKMSEKTQRTDLSLGLKPTPMGLCHVPNAPHDSLREP